MKIYAVEYVRPDEFGSIADIEIKKVYLNKDNAEAFIEKENDVPIKKYLEMQKRRFEEFGGEYEYNEDECIEDFYFEKAHYSLREMEVEDELELKKMENLEKRYYELESLVDNSSLYQYASFKLSDVEFELGHSAQEEMGRIEEMLLDKYGIEM